MMRSPANIKESPVSEICKSSLNHWGKNVTSWKINMETKNEGLEDDFSFQCCAVLGSMLTFRNVQYSDVRDSGPLWLPFKLPV